MSSMTLDFPRRFPWPALLSVVIHGAVLAGILYTSMHQVTELPSPAQPISVTMVNPADLAPPAPAPAPQVTQPEPEPEPVVEPEPVPEAPKEAPVVIHKPKPKPKPVKRVEHRKEPVKPVEKPVEQKAPPQDNPFTGNAAPRSSSAQNATANTAPVNTAPRGPKALSRNQPQYPSRAFALRIEGNVRVKFDVAADGSVENIQILSAKPANMFERDVRQAMRNWRYESGRPGKGLVVNIIFRINGGASME